MLFFVLLFAMDTLQRIRLRDAASIIHESHLTAKELELFIDGGLDLADCILKMNLGDNFIKFVIDRGDRMLEYKRTSIALNKSFKYILKSIFELEK